MQEDCKALDEVGCRPLVGNLPRNPRADGLTLLGSSGTIVSLVFLRFDAVRCPMFRSFHRRLIRVS